RTGGVLGSLQRRGQPFASLQRPTRAFNMEPRAGGADAGEWSEALMATMLHPVYEFRPLPDAFPTNFCRGKEVFRYADGQWLPDDGEYDIAFVSGPFCLMVELPYQRNIIWSWLTGHWQANEPRHPHGNPWHYMLREGETEWGGNWGRDNHPNRRAGDA